MPRRRELPDPQEYAERNHPCLGLYTNRSHIIWTKTIDTVEPWKAAIVTSTESSDKEGGNAMRKLDGAALILVIVGALNWGLVAVAEYDLVASIFGMEFGETSAITRVVYGLVGLLRPVARRAVRHPGGP